MWPILIILASLCVVALVARFLWMLFVEPNNLCPSCKRHSLNPTRSRPMLPTEWDGWRCFRPESRAVFDRDYQRVDPQR